ncbi:dihydroorotate dehydrogenase electron transfer subunit [Kitasatospora sp. MAP12-15]|uniref:dihydroorotate dehydrogenase electron transfer subunit n=1 Tax=unclassified Kitasatospora TaxID=2633591 RepID=UPI002476DE37|nr:dihydroorotate dehydrogenase electron transfer subunit [Kitasatospora sp. MAP12-44]MDH6114296.1 dihydroorotate dehydrogenase electron transfer subunit [Kitasatospora sp. MAP12-44]
MANPLHLRAEVLANTPEGAYRRLVLRAPGVPERARPGHFATLAVGGATSSMLLRRAFSIHRGDPEAGTVELLVSAHGAGTRELAESTPGEQLDLIAPLGTPFPLPEGPVTALLVADGYAGAPLFDLAARILRLGGQVGFILGAPSADRLFGVEQARALTQDVLVLTEDGTLGMTGRVADPLAQAVHAIEASVLYAAGPVPMLSAVSATAVELGVRCHTAVEAAMACGVGICMTCVLPVVGEDGVSRFVRTCTDGPVFDGARVRWADIGTVPPDLEGAAAMGGNP